MIVHMGEQFLLLTGLEWSNSMGVVQSHVSRTARLSN